jgi:hypothetical protein
MKLFLSIVIMSTSKASVTPTNGFRKACEMEYITLEGKDCWDDVDPPQHWPVISRSWPFRIKWLLDGSMRNLKA